MNNFRAMRKTFIAVALSLLGLSSVSAQESDTTQSAFKKNIITVKAGLGVSKTLSRGLSTSSVVGYHVGVSDQINVSKSMPLYVETGLFANMKGYKILGYDESETKMHYLQLPALVNYHIGKQGGFEVIPSAGVYLGLGLAGKLKYNIDLDTYKEIDVFKDKTIKRFDFGTQMGVDVVFRKVQVGFAYDLGLIEIDKKDAIYGDSEEKLGYRNLKNRSAIFRLGLNF